MTEPSPEARPRGRTRLAWQRTTLSALVCLLAVERLMADVSVPVTALLAVLGVVALAPPTWSLVAARLGRPAQIDGRPLIMVTAIAVLAGLAGLAYALIA